MTLVLAFAAAASAALPSVHPPTWVPLASNDGIATFSREVPGSPLVAFRGECVVRAPMGKVVSVLADVSRHREWMDKLVESRVVRQISPWERVEYNHSDAPWPVSDRDFVFRWTAALAPDQRSLTVRLNSVEEQGAPAKTGVVRGRLVASTWTIEALDGGSTRVAVEIQADPRGWVPKWVVNLFQRSWPRQSLEGLRRQAAKADVPADPRLLP